MDPQRHPCGLRVIPRHNSHKLTFFAKKNETDQNNIETAFFPFLYYFGRTVLARTGITYFIL